MNEIIEVIKNKDGIIVFIPCIESETAKTIIENVKNLKWITYIYTSIKIEQTNKWVEV